MLSTSLVEVDVEVEADVGRESFEDLTEVIESDRRSKRSRRELNVLYQGSQYRSSSIGRVKNGPMNESRSLFQIQQYFLFVFVVD